MNIEIIIAIFGFLWWLFFEWMRGWKRNRERGTQHFCLIGLLGMGTMIVALGVFLLRKIL